MLYAKYSNPMDLVDRYIKQRRFGKFVQSFAEMEYERKKQEAERDQEWMLWVAYVQFSVHEFFGGTFEEYKKFVMKPASTTRRRGSDADMTEKEAQSIMDRLFKTPQE